MLSTAVSASPVIGTTPQPGFEAQTATALGWPQATLGRARPPRIHLPASERAGAAGLLPTGPEQCRVGATRDLPHESSAHPSALFPSGPRGLRERDGGLL